MRAFALFAALASASCHTGSYSAAGAAANLAIGLSASAISRASGGCYAVCQQGEQCNEKTGLCESLPCKGKCLADETCEETFLGVKCMPGTPLSVSSSSVAPAKATLPEAPAAKPKDQQPPKDKQPVPDAAKP